MNTANVYAKSPDYLMSFLSNFCNIPKRVDMKGTSKSAVLQSSALYDDSKFHPAPYISDHCKLIGFILFI